MISILLWFRREARSSILVDSQSMNKVYGLSLPSYLDMFCAAPQTITRIMSKISDHREHNKYNNNLKVWKVIIMKMWHRHKLANDVGKMMPIALHVAGCHKSAISYKTQFLWSPVKQSIMKPDVPVFSAVLCLPFYFKETLNSRVSRFSHIRLFAISWTCSSPGSSVHGFSRQQYWSGLTFQSPGDLSNPGIEPGSPALQADSLPLVPPGKPKETLT